MTVRSIETIDAAAPLEKINEAIKRDGGVIVANFLSESLLQEFLKGLEPFLEEFSSSMKDQVGELGGDFFPEGSQRVYAMFGKLPGAYSQVLTSRVWNGVMDHFLSDEYSSFTGETLVPMKSGYMLASTAALRQAPGAKAQNLHRDQLGYQVRFDPARPFFTPIIGCLIAGTKCTRRNGATLVIPGSHLWEHDRAPKVEEASFAEMEPGSALFTLGSLYHAGGENQCHPGEPNAIRTLFGCFGQRDYYRQDQEEILTTPLEVVRGLSPEVLRLAGYYKAVGGVGHVYHHQSAGDLMDKCTLGQFKQ